jgi:CBS domain-containing protein
MQARDLMTDNPACCRSDSSIRDAARLMVEHDCGEIPVLDQSGAPIGVITDRDVCCRLVAQGIDCVNSKVGDFMTTPAIVVRKTDSAEDCRMVMEENKIRRVPVVDSGGLCVGIISQADLAKKTDSYMVSHFVKEVSTPTPNSEQYGGM